MTTPRMILSLICSAVAILAAALGAQIYRWELIIWAAAAAVFAFLLWAADQ